MKQLILWLSFSLTFVSCQGRTSTEILQSNNSSTDPESETSYIAMGAERIEAYLPLLKDQRLALVVNPTSMVGKLHLVDTLLALGADIRKVFAPEHGFRGQTGAGELINDSLDKRTGLPITSIYGKNKKPSAAQLADVDMVLFDIQDVGTRFYTYISTMHYVMEACAEQGKTFVVLDRPNPNGMYIDGPVRQQGFRSFVGMHPIPILHGLTVGEMALMINGEKWLKNGVQCSLQVIEMKRYDHSKKYSLPIKPSPNLPNDLAIRLYPSLCLFEGTSVSVGRGTEAPFQHIGYPGYQDSSYSFTPRSIENAAKYPKHEDIKCFGIDFRKVGGPSGFSLKYLIEFYRSYPEKEQFFSGYFNQLAGNDRLQSKIKQGLSPSDIRKGWREELKEYRSIRKKYLLYADK